MGSRADAFGINKCVVSGLVSDMWVSNSLVNEIVDYLGTGTAHYRKNKGVPPVRVCLIRVCMVFLHEVLDDFKLGEVASSVESSPPKLINSGI